MHHQLMEEVAFLNRCDSKDNELSCKYQVTEPDTPMFCKYLDGIRFLSSHDSFCIDIPVCSRLCKS